MRADLARWGLTPAQIEAELAKRGQREDAEPLGLPAAREGRAATLFVAMETQWRWAGMGARVGLDYAMIETTARLTGVEIEPRDELFAMLRIMEDAALGVWASKAGR